MPELMAFCEEFKDRRGEFEIVAFHDATAKTLAEVAERTEQVKREVWGGRDLPFPVLVDATGTTIETYEIRMFPTVLLIDPQGNLVRHGSEAMLRQRLRESSPEVMALVKSLVGAKEGAGRVASDLAAKGGDAALYALIAFARDHALPKDLPTLFVCIGRIGGEGALVFLAEQAQAALPASRAAAVAGLAASGDARLAEWLEERLASETDAEVKKAIEAALAKLAG
ncbi:MAG: peroxiredoxin family protein [Planctomycetaceae bacterium]